MVELDIMKDVIVYVIEELSKDNFVVFVLLKDLDNKVVDND